MTLYFVLDRGDRLHIAQDSHYQGSLRIYLHSIDQIIAKLFNLHVTISINDEYYVVNRREYEQLCATMRMEKDFLTIVPTIYPIKTNPCMHQMLSMQKTYELSIRLLTALQEEDAAQALTLIGSGANPNFTFWARESPLPWTKGDLWDQLPPHTFTSHSVEKYTVFLFACKKKWGSVAKLLIEIGADLSIKGEIGSLKRELSGERVALLQQHHSFVNSPPSIFTKDRWLDTYTKKQATSISPVNHTYLVQAIEPITYTHFSELL